MKSHPYRLYQHETSGGALEGQPSPFTRCKAAAPDHPGEEGLAHLRAYAYLPEPVSLTHSSHREGTNPEGGQGQDG